MRSPDAEQPPTASGRAAAQRGREGYVLHTDVEEVVLNATVLDGNRLVQDLKKDNFQVFEDGVKAEHHQLSAHRSSGFDCAGGRQLGIDVEQAARCEQERAGPDSGFESRRTRPLS